MSDTCNIRVICRFRPTNNRESDEETVPQKGPANLEFPDEKTIKVISQYLDVGTGNMAKGNEIYTFDRVFWKPQTTQVEVYESAVSDCIKDVIEGYNSTIFAYGQTGSGKSYTMFGPDIMIPEQRGIIPRACSHIFSFIRNSPDGVEFSIKCSFLEIYKEVIRDLLSPKGYNLKIRETPSRGTWVDGLTEQYVGTEADIYELIKTGEKYRAVSATNMNAVSSRSHSLFILTLIQKFPDGSSKMGKLNLADLAGSEKIGKTGATGETLEEAKKINQSLSTLGNCINALTKSKRGYIPYRDSKLTHILRESLGGNCKTTLIITCSPHKFNFDETVSTLKFGQRAKTIKNSVSINKQRSVTELNTIIDKLNQEVISLNAYIESLEGLVREAKGPNFDFANFKKNKLSAVIEAVSRISSNSDLIKEEELNDNNASNSNEDEPFSNHKDEEEECLTPKEDEEISKHEQVSPKDEEQPPKEAEPESIIKSYNILPAVEAQLELEKLKESTSLQIQELTEDLAQLTQKEEEHQKEINSLRQQLNAERSYFEKLQTSLDEKTFQYGKEVGELQYRYKQALLELEAFQLKENQAKQNYSELEKEISNLKEKLNEATQKHETFANQVIRLEGERDLQNSTLTLAQERYANLEDRFTRANGEVRTLSSQKVQLELEIETKNSKLTRIQEDLETLQTSLSEIKAELSFMKEEKRNLESLLESSKNNVASLEKEQKVLREEKFRAEEALAIAKALEALPKPNPELDALKLEYEKLNYELSQLKSRLEESGKAKDNLEIKLNEEKEKLKLSEQTITSLNQELADLKSASETTQSLNLEKIKQLTSLLDSEQQVKTEISNQLKDTQAKLFESENEIRKVTGELAIVKQKLDIETSANLPEKVAELMTINSELQEKLLNFENEVAAMKLQHENMKKEQEIAFKETENMKISHEQFQQETSLKQVQLEEELKSLQQREKLLTQENDQQKEKIQSLETEYSQIETEKKEALQNLSALNEEKERLTKTLHTVEENLAEVEKKFELSRQQYEKLASDNTLQIELESMKKYNQELNEKIESLEDSNNKLQKEISGLKIELDKVKAARDSAEKKFLQEREESVTIQEKTRLLTQQLEESKLKLDEQKEGFESKLRKAESNLQTELEQKKGSQKLLDVYQEKIKSRDIEIEKLRTEMENLRKETSKKEDKFILQNKTLQQKDESILSQSLIIDKLNAKIETLQKQLDTQAKATLEMEESLKKQIELNDATQKLNEMNMRGKIATPVNQPSFLDKIIRRKGSISSTLNRELSKIVKEGWLTQQSALIKKTWKKRWCVVEGERFMIFKDSEAKELKSLIIIEPGFTVTDASEITKKQFSFMITIPSSKKCLFFMANSSTEMEEWVIAINEKIPK